MNRRFWSVMAILVVAAIGTAVLAGAAATATAVKVKATLNVGQERPKPTGTKQGARGTFTGTLNGRSLSWKLTYTRLTGPAGAAHIHVGARGTPGDVVIALCGEEPACKSGITGTVRLTRAQANALKAGGYYVNVHTAKNAAGEIRGQLGVVS